MNKTKQLQRLNKHSSQEPDPFVYGKVPPHAAEIEMAVLGAIMLERDALDLILEIIPAPEVFYAPANQAVFRAIQALHSAGGSVDIMTVIAQLTKSGEIDLVGGAYYITSLTMNVVTAAHVEAHARILLEHYLGRELIRQGGEMVRNGYDQTLDVFDSLDGSQEALMQLAMTGIKKDYLTSAKSVQEVIQAMEEQLAAKVEFTGVTTPFADLNRCTGGWQKTDLIILAARPAVGKTAFSLACALACASAAHHGGPVGIFNLEMAHGQMTKRMISSLAGVDFEKVQKPWIATQEELQRVHEAGNRLAQMKIVIDDTAGLTITELRVKARRMKKRQGIKLLIIDYLQLMTAGVDNRGNREQEIAKISRELKKLAKDLEIPVIALSQLSRGLETRADNEPKLSDLRESGSIEQDSDIVIFLYGADKKTLAQKPELAGKVMVNIAKHRNGETKEFVYQFQKHIQRWEEPTWEIAGGNWKQVNVRNYSEPVAVAEEEPEDLPF